MGVPPFMIVLSENTSCYYSLYEHLAFWLGFLRMVLLCCLNSFSYRLSVHVNKFDFQSCRRYVCLDLATLYYLGFSQGFKTQLIAGKNVKHHNVGQTVFVLFCVTFTN